MIAATKFGVRTILWTAGSAVCLLLTSSIPGVDAATAVTPQAAATRQMVNTMLNNEMAAAQHKDHYAYLSRERSDRTGGHLWTEKVVETNYGKIHFLLQEDGQPLSPNREAEERGRLAAIVADPAGWMKRQQATREDELHARQLLTLMPNAFLFSEPRDEGGYVRIDYAPNPDYQPQSMEQRVLHAMTGTMQVDPRAMRLREIDGHLPQDVSIGFGLLATIRAGSHFATTRDSFGQLDWKTTLLDTDVNGKAIFFKSIAKKQHSEHSSFVRIDDNVAIPQAVALAEQP